MNDPRFFQTIVMLLGLVAVLALWRAGCFRRATLVEAPRRPTALHLHDLVVGVVLYLLLGAALPAVYVLLRVTLIGRPGRGARGLAGLRALGLHFHRPRRQLVMSGLALLAGLPMLVGLGIAVSQISLVLDLETPTVAHDLLRELQTTESLARVASISFIAVVLAPLLEELAFRGLMQSALLTWLGRSWRWTIVFVAAALFAVIHLPMVPWQALPMLLVLGLILGWLYERTGSLWPPILMHAGYNAFNIALVMLAYPSPTTTP